jgi:hypothetical protein
MHLSANLPIVALVPRVHASSFIRISIYDPVNYRHSLTSYNILSEVTVDLLMMHRNDTALIPLIDQNPAVLPPSLTSQGCPPIFLWTLYIYKDQIQWSLYLCIFNFYIHER